MRDIVRIDDCIMGTAKTIPIIFEDNHIIVVVKPPGILSMADRTGDDDLLTILKDDLKKRYNKPGNVYLGLVHRLDRPVGGLMVFAKTSKAAGRLSTQFREKTFGKKYLAVVHGVPSKPEDILKNNLVKDRRNNIVYTDDNKSTKSKRAELGYKVTQKKNGLALLEVNLRTGRFHQIRVQLSLIGNPLYGDNKYGKAISRKDGSPNCNEIALWCAEIYFTHPISKEVMSFKNLPSKKYPWTIFDALA